MMLLLLQQWAWEEGQQGVRIDACGSSLLPLLPPQLSPPPAGTPHLLEPLLPLLLLARPRLHGQQRDLLHRGARGGVPRLVAHGCLCRWSNWRCQGLVLDKSAACKQQRRRQQWRRQVQHGRPAASMQ